MKKYLVLAILAIIIDIGTVFSQNCTEKKVYVEKCNPPNDNEFVDAGKSMSFPLFKGKTQKMVITLQGNRQYYLSVCSEKGDKLVLKIKNGSNPEEIIFDNSSFDDLQSIEFSLLSTNKLIFEITLPEGSGKGVDTNATCVGMLLYYKNI
jgi:hypothetical protein